MFVTGRIVLSLALSLLIGGLAYRRESLSIGGWAGAVVVGTLTAGLGGWDWGLLVIVFFVSSSALSHAGVKRKAHYASNQWEKGARRDWGQVLANGGVVSALAIVWSLWPDDRIWAAAVGSLATVTGDTWATEIGVLSSRPPRLITTGRLVAPGTSGGVTSLGSMAALAGTLFIGVCAAGLELAMRETWRPWIIGSALLGGAAGVALDSFLGATVQAMRWCPTCRQETERREHGCGSPTIAYRGWIWLDNDRVNLLASLAGALCAAWVAGVN